MERFSRRQFITGGAVAALGGTLALAGCAPSGSSNAKGSNGAGSGSSAGIGSGMGKHGQFDVEVMVTDGNLDRITVLNSRETPGMGDVAMEELTQLIVDNQTLNVATRQRPRRPSFPHRPMSWWWAAAVPASRRPSRRRTQARASCCWRRWECSAATPRCQAARWPRRATGSRCRKASPTAPTRWRRTCWKAATTQAILPSCRSSRKARWTARSGSPSKAASRGSTTSCSSAATTRSAPSSPSRTAAAR